MTSRTRNAGWWGAALLLGIFTMATVGCGSNDKQTPVPPPDPTPTPTPSPTQVTSLVDMDPAPANTVTLRSAWAVALTSHAPKRLPE